MYPELVKALCVSPPRGPDGIPIETRVDHNDEMNSWQLQSFIHAFIHL